MKSLGSSFGFRPSTSVHPARRRILASFLLLGVILYLVGNRLDNIGGVCGRFLQSRRYGPDPSLHRDREKEWKRVPLEAHIMSKCPDARDCLQQLVVPAMERITDIVDFKLSFIASTSNTSSEIICKHGPSECIGNMLMLCAINILDSHLPSSLLATTAYSSHTQTMRSLGFANCLAASYQRIPKRALVEKCAYKYDIDFDALNKCVSEQEDDPGDPHGKPPLSGLALLRQSALHSEELGISTSCTVRLDETVWCVRDGGIWKDCAYDGQGSKVSVLIDEVERRWKERNI